MGFFVKRGDYSILKKKIAPSLINLVDNFSVITLRTLKL